MSKKSYKSDARIIDSDNDSDDEFTPPTGYKKVSLSSKVIPSLKDKQLWLIQIPPNIDLSKIKSLPIAFDSHSEPTFSINDSLYTTSLEEEDPTSRIRLLVPKSNGKQLKVATKSISKCFKISEQVTIPEIDTDKVRTPKPIVKQKEGLYMRHFATGYGSSQFTESKPKEEVIATAESNRKSTQSKSKKEKKHKHHDEGDEAERPKKKKKKKSLA